MEFAIIIGLLAFGILALRKPQKRRHRQNRSIPTPSRAQPAQETKPFDSKTARIEPGQKSIRGPAYIIDGDTLRIQKTQVRLFGVDAPELDHPFGKKAKWALVSLCKGQSIHAEILETDKYGRAVAKCTLEDGRDISEEMVKLGLALDWHRFSGGAYRQFECADARRKLWLADARQKGRMHIWREYESGTKSHVAN